MNRQRDRYFFTSNENSTRKKRAKKDMNSMTGRRPFKHTSSEIIAAFFFAIFFTAYRLKARLPNRIISFSDATALLISVFSLSIIHLHFLTFFFLCFHFLFSLCIICQSSSVFLNFPYNYFIHLLCFFFFSANLLFYSFSWITFSSLFFLLSTSN